MEGLMPVIEHKSNRQQHESQNSLVATVATLLFIL
jgi:hypothetical protein